MLKHDVIESSMHAAAAEDSKSNNQRGGMPISEPKSKIVDLTKSNSDNDLRDSESDVHSDVFSRPPGVAESGAEYSINFHHSSMYENGQSPMYRHALISPQWPRKAFASISTPRVISVHRPVCPCMWSPTQRHRLTYDIAKQDSPNRLDWELPRHLR